MMRTERLIEYLGVSHEAQKQCTTIISTPIKRERDKESRHKHGVLEREEYEAKRKGNLEANMRRARELRDQGMSRKAIAEELGKSRQSIDLYLKESK
jgi:hypothetical protein